MNKMQEIRIEKLCLNIGVGEAGEKLKKAKILLERLSGVKPVETKGKKKIPTWGVRPGLPIGTKVTIRKNVDELLKRLIEAKEKVLNKSSFSSSGVSFGVDEYIYIPGMDYDPDLGIMGIDVNVVMSRPGARVTKRNLKTASIGKRHIIKPEEAIKFMKDKYGVIIK